jgi:hypothetical protein
MWGHERRALKGVREGSFRAYSLVKLSDGDVKSIFHTSAPRFVQKKAALHRKGTPKTPTARHKNTQQK